MKAATTRYEDCDPMEETEQGRQRLVENEDILSSWQFMLAFRPTNRMYPHLQPHAMQAPDSGNVGSNAAG